MEATTVKFQGIDIPTPSDCLALMAAHGMLPNIREHSLLVREVALRLGIRLEKAGLALRIDLIEAGALLHDLGKTACLGTSNDHSEWGAKALDAAGFPEVAQIVREHVFLKPPGQEPRPVREAEVVNYADKRVLHARVVTLQKRFADLRERYGKSPEALSRIAGLEQAARRLEAKLFAPLSFDPSDLLELNDARREL